MASSQLSDISLLLEDLARATTWFYPAVCSQLGRTHEQGCIEAPERVDPNDSTAVLHPARKSFV